MRRISYRTLPRMGTLAVGAMLLAAGCGQTAPQAPSAVGAGTTKATATATHEHGEYCKEHGVPEEFCTLCHPELKEKLLLCKEHNDIPEDICTLCHPEVEKKHNIVMCPKGHKLPEHFCYECAKSGPDAT